MSTGLFIKILIDNWNFHSGPYSSFIFAKSNVWSTFARVSAGGQGGLGRGEILVWVGGRVGKEKEGGHPEIPHTFWTVKREKG